MSAPSGGRSAARSAGIVGLAVLSSRILGLVREMVFASLFGAGRSLDAFLIAFRTPNLLRDLFAEGALSTAFVTTFSKKIATEGEHSAWSLANKVATLTAVFMSGVVLLGVLFAPWIIRIMAPGFDPEKMALTILLARIMYPFILLVSLAALVMGMLNARQVFGMPAMASSFFNLGSIVAGVGLGWWLDPAWGPRALVGLALGTLVGGFLQLVVQFPALRRVGYRFRPDFIWRDPGVRRVLGLMGPAVVAASAVQVNVLINGIFASHLEDGAVSWLQIAFRLMQFPLGIFGVAIGTVTLPLVARNAALGNMEGFREVLARGMRLALFLTIPAAVGLIVLADPIISLLYERGKFDAAMTAQTAGALRYYALGLVAYSALKVLTPAFYAIDRRHTPMVIGFVSIATNAVLNWVLTFQFGMGHRGLALSTGAVAVINFVVLYAIMWRHLGRLENRALVGFLLRTLVAAAALGAICLWGSGVWLADWAGAGLGERVLRLFSLIGVAGTAFFGVALALRVSEMREVGEVIARKLRRG